MLLKSEHTDESVTYSRGRIFKALKISAETLLSYSTGGNINWYKFMENNISIT